MTTVTSFSELISALGGPAKTARLAEDLDGATKEMRTANTVQQMSFRDSAAPRHWETLRRLAEAAGLTNGAGEPVGSKDLEAWHARTAAAGAATPDSASAETEPSRVEGLSSLSTKSAGASCDAPARPD